MTNSTSTVVTNTTSSFPDNWNDLFLLDQPLDMDAFLQSDLFGAKRKFYMNQFIANLISGSISFTASMLLAIHILRSHDCLSTTYHRLVFGLSAADIISSFGIALSSIMVPNEMSYLVPFASSNIAICDAQGFLNSLAVVVSVGYNCSICLYYLAIISYNKRFDYIRRKLEPWFHGVSILVPFVICVILLATNSYNGPNGGTCFMEPYYPPHCIGYEAGDIPKGYNIPCGRGGPYDGQARFRTITWNLAWLWVLIIAPVIILVTMASMFRSVAKVEKRIQKYGVRALRIRTKLATPSPNDDSAGRQQEARGFAVKLKKLGKYLCLTKDASQTNHRFPICCLRRPFASDAVSYDPEKPSRTTQSNEMKSQKRAVLYMAFGYGGAFLLAFAPFFGRSVSLIVQNSVSEILIISSASISPLQGFFNFLVFMAPKVRITRTFAMRTGRGSDNNNQNQQRLTWCQAFYKAYSRTGK